MIAWAIQKREHAYVQFLYFRLLVPAIDRYGAVYMHVRLIRAPALACEFFHVQAVVKLPFAYVFIGIHQEYDSLS